MVRADREPPPGPSATPSTRGCLPLRRVQLAEAMQDDRTGGMVDPISQADLTASIHDLLVQR